LGDQNDGLERVGGCGAVGRPLVSTVQVLVFVGCV
jgi:hypothetical protein